MPPYLCFVRDGELRDDDVLPLLAVVDQLLEQRQLGGGGHTTRVVDLQHTRARPKDRYEYPPKNNLPPTFNGRSGRAN